MTETARKLQKNSKYDKKN